MTDVDKGQIRERLLRYYLTFVDAHQERLQGNFHALTVEQDTLWSLISWTISETKTDALISLLLGLRTYIDMRGFWEDGLMFIGQALTFVADQPMDERTVRLKVAQGHYLYQLSRYDEAIEILQSALEWSEGASTESYMFSLFNLGCIYVEKYESSRSDELLEEATVMLTRCQELATALANLEIQARSLQQLGRLNLIDANLEDAEKHLQAALALTEAPMSLPADVVASTYYFLGVIFHFQEAYDKAEIYYDRSKIYSDAGGMDSILEAEILTNKAELAIDRKQPELARERLQQAYSVVQRLQIESLLDYYDYLASQLAELDDTSM